MKKNYINIYNTLINLTRNKDLYQTFKNQDTFSDRLIFFMLHFAFFLKVYKNENNKLILQDIYDYIFRQIELSIREIGYGDQTINKKMKDYLNLFYLMITDIDEWEKQKIEYKKAIFTKFFENKADAAFLVKYFDKFMLDLSNNTLNSFIKGVIKL